MSIQPLCRYCGKKIAKSTIKHWFGDRVEFYKNSPDRHIHHGEKPRSREEAQKYINEQVISVQWSRLYQDGELLPREQQFINRVGVWDGESYEDKFFCNDDHARRMGYVVAHEGRCTAEYNAALRRQRETNNVR